MSHTYQKGLPLIDLTEHDPSVPQGNILKSKEETGLNQSRKVVTIPTLEREQDDAQVFMDLTRSQIHVIKLKNADWTTFRSFHYPEDHTCIICYRTFNDHQRRPIGLNCGHAICCMKCVLNNIGAKLGINYAGGLVLDDHVQISPDKTRIRAWLRTPHGQKTNALESMYAVYQCPYRCRPKPIFMINHTMCDTYTIVLDAPNFTCLPKMKKLRIMVEQKDKESRDTSSK